MDFFVKTQYLYEKINFYEKMAKEKNLVEEALIQMKNLEEAVAENAKGILASTMKEEIKELVKESIVSEQGEDDEIETTDDEMDVDMDSDDMDVDMDSDDEDMDLDMDSDEMDMDMDSDIDDTEMDDEVIDLSGEDISDEDLLKVFLAMDENDGVIVKKDDRMINLRDENTDKEYMIQTESEEEMEESMDDIEPLYNEMEEDDMDDEMMESYDEMEEDDMYDEMEESYEEMEEDDSMDSEGDSIEDIVNAVFGEPTESDDENFDEEEVVYEIELDDEDDEKIQGIHMESTKPKVGKGGKIGKPKFSYKKSSGGFKESMKQGTRGVGMGKPKFEFKEGAKDISSATKKEMSAFNKKETKEAARTLGMGSKFRKGGLPKPRAYSKFNMNIDESKYQEQIDVLREKNEEYRKALNVFRDKLNEVAIFNSNLAYATRLFTEHSTSKQEKINILRRFDSAETLKESKNLYRTIKDELSSKNKSSLTESIEERIERTPTSGSASTLIESKTYENPQFLRMKDIMSKIIK
jgi:hypothetical protein